MAYNPAYTVTIYSVKDSPNKPPVLVQAPMPESFMYDAAVMYEAPFTQGLTGNAAIDTIMKVGFASKLVMHSMTAQIWQGSTETDLGLELEFHAERDPISEVRDPIVNLLRLCTPSVNAAGMLESPGPKLEGQILRDLVFAVQNLDKNVPDGTQGQVSQGQLRDPAQTSIQGSGNSAQNSNGRSTTIGTTDYFKSRIQDQISIQIGKYAFFDSVVITNVQKTYESQFDERTGLPFYAKVAVRFKPFFMVTQEDLNKIFGINRGGTPTTIGSAPTSVGTAPLTPAATPAFSATPAPVSAARVPVQASKPPATSNSGGSSWNGPSPSIRSRIDAGGYPKKVD